MGCCCSSNEQESYNEPLIDDVKEKESSEELSRTKIIYKNWVFKRVSKLPSKRSEWMRGANILRDAAKLHSTL